MGLSIGIGLGLTSRAGGGAVPLTPPVIRVVYTGQSDMGTLMESGFGSADAAAAGTYWWNPSNNAWETPPAVPGLRKFLNDLATYTGKSVGAVGYAPAASSIGDLSSGADYATLSGRITASGGRADALIFWQGHGNISGQSNSSSLDFDSTERTWLAVLDSFHGSLATLCGKTKSTFPVSVSGLQRSHENIGTVSVWNNIQRAILTAPEVLTNGHYSHSCTDLALLSETPTYDDHVTSAETVKAGARYARTVARTLGYLSQTNEFLIASAAVATATTTTVTLVHGAGTDITPTTGITGFEVSADNGKTWLTATGARASATTITLTHTSIGNDRLTRYQWGWTPDITGAVKDNSTLAVPLPRSRDEMLASGRTVVVPMPLWVGRVFGALSAGNTVSTHQFLTRSPGAHRRFYGFVNVFDVGATISAIVIKNGLTGATLATATIIDQHANNVAMRSATFSADVAAGTVIDVEVTYGSTVSAAQVALWELDSSLISSVSAVYADLPYTGTTDRTTVTATALSVTANGAVLALGNNWNTLPATAANTYKAGTVVDLGGEKAALFGSGTTFTSAYGLSADAAFTATHTISDANLEIAVHAMAIG